jgi:hypothetical protein
MKMVNATSKQQVESKSKCFLFLSTQTNHGVGFEPLTLKTL